MKREQYDAFFQIIANTPMERRQYRFCQITGEYLPIGEDGLTQPERENHEQIKKQWQQ